MIEYQQFTVTSAGLVEPDAEGITILQKVKNY
jgi:hypothetical protein